MGFILLLIENSFLRKEIKEAKQEILRKDELKGIYVKSNRKQRREIERLRQNKSEIENKYLKMLKIVSKLI